MLLVKKCQISLYLDLVEIRLEIMLNNFVEDKETFFGYSKKKFFLSPKNLIFPKGLNVWSKYAVFFFICFRSKKGLEIRFNDVLVEKEILSIRTKFFNVLKIAFFRRG